MEESKTVVIRKGSDGELLTVSDVEQNRGKMITYLTSIQPGITDAFNVGVSSKSLEQLRTRMDRNVFHWVIKDRSLEITGRNGQISLRFVSQGPSLTVDISLSSQEAQLLRTALFDGRDIVNSCG